mmetsp:Transcript_17514/g.27050  ORF Transcript_17514/g.27050 Transcript_17514/m.27050 type:complete len:104 (-) Transcript_17514:116-427(-)
MGTEAQIESFPHHEHPSKDVHSSHPVKSKARHGSVEQSKQSDSKGHMRSPSSSSTPASHSELYFFLKAHGSVFQSQSASIFGGLTSNTTIAKKLSESCDIQVI